MQLATLGLKDYSWTFWSIKFLKEEAISDLIRQFQFWAAFQLIVEYSIGPEKIECDKKHFLHVHPDSSPFLNMIWIFSFSIFQQFSDPLFWPTKPVEQR